MDLSTPKPAAFSVAVDPSPRVRDAKQAETAAAALKRAVGLTMPYTTSGAGWLSRLCGGRSRAEGDVDDDDGSNGTPLPDDALAAVFIRLPGAGDAVRCSATCRRWGRVVAKEAAVLGRALPLPAEVARGRALLGLFHQDDPGVTAPRKRKRFSSPATSAAGAGQPLFVPTAAGARLLALPSPNSMSDGGGLRFGYSRPVASRNGRVVLELGREGNADGLKLCVFNPMTGDAALLPPLAGKDKPGYYACALLTADDLPERQTSALFFRVLIVYSRRSFTALRAYSSDTNRWGSEAAARSHNDKIDDRRLRKLGQGVVVRGVAFWPLRHSALAVRLDGPEPAEVPMPPTGTRADRRQSFRLLGVTPDTKRQLCFLDARFTFHIDLFKAGLPYWSIIVVTTILHTVDGGGDGDMSTAKWETRKGWITLPDMKVSSCGSVNLRWFCEKSGVIVFTVGEDTGPGPGAYALNVATQEVEKLAHGAACHQWRNVVGYEMDAAGYLLASTQR